MGKYNRNEAEWQSYLNRHNIKLVSYDCPTIKSQAILNIHCLTCDTAESVRADNLTRRKNHPCTTCGNYQFYTTENIKALIEKNGGVYISGEVTGKMSKVTLKCPCGEIVVKTAHDIRRRPKSCKKCRGKQISSAQLRKNDNWERAQVIAEERGGKCLAKKGLFSTREKILWECSQGHQWKANLDSVSNQETWCKICQTSIAENMVRAILEETYQRPFPNSQPKFLKGLELDAYNEELGLAIECQGIQHYEKSPHFHSSQTKFVEQLERDVLKATLCQANLVTLITVPYTVTDHGLEATQKFIARMLFESGILPLQDPRDIKIDPRKIYDTSDQAAFQEFKKIVNKRNGTFNKVEYRGLTKPLAITCQEGHVFLMQPNHVKLGHWCPTCAGNKTRTLEDIDEQLQKEGWSLDNPEKQTYTNAHQELKMLCPNGHRITRPWNKWQQGRRFCKDCQQLEQAQDFVDKMRMRGFRMDVDLSEYKGEGQRVRGICTHCNQETTLPVEQWKNRALAPCCSRTLPAYHRCHMTDQDSVPA